ncbi:6-bladed beta-propeller [Algoriphagus antarcticus]|uniref:6-bladed beta-propeller protein n=1 Tax=Algoriphagus antarcticus TaxID=238540 RepID=A0A3E0D8D1_9BACT|nr:6-bladed beta-propeller [Algoriphagus antarcticus]REG78345.1 6-bladed beta-propeller protein [Algoriphagus antarcticus]
MKKLNPVILIFYLVLLQSCNKKVEVEVSGIPYTIEISKQFLTSELPELQFVALDTVDLEIPGNLSLTFFQDMAFAKNFFFILDVRQGLLKFDYEGNYLKTIGAKGQGPDEYNGATSIYLDEKNDIILVTDWSEMSVVSYDFEGNFIASEKFPGQPIFLFQHKDSLLVVQEDAFGSQEKYRMNLIVSTIDPKKLMSKQQVSVLYSYVSELNTFYNFPGILAKLNEKTLFYLPRPRFEGLTEHKDTIYRKVDDHLVPEYLLHFTEFDRTDTLSISHLEMFDGYVSMLFNFKKQEYMIMLDLVNNLPLSYMSHPLDNRISTIDIENFPKHLNENMFYVILRNNEEEEESNPKIVFYRFDN